MSFLKRFQTTLESLYIPPKKSHYVIAYSGGVDSHVLLQCCVTLNLPVRVIHVHHGLQTVADHWVKHCETICKQLNVELEVIYVDATKQRRESPEESARKARYQALHSNLDEGDCLLLGQHLNDQAETVLLQLFRGSGAAGLAAMPARRKFTNNVQLRPLLTFSRNEIVDYAKENHLQWVDDPSNTDTRYERNFIRAEVMPLLEKRWPEITAKFASVAKIQANNLSVMEDMAAIDLANASLINKPILKFRFYSVVSLLSISKLKRLSSSRLLNVLRYWISQSSILELSGAKKLITKNLLQELEQSFLLAQQSSKAVISFAEYEFRKYQDSLYLLKPKIASEAMTEIRSGEFTWNPSVPLVLNSVGIELESSLLSNADGLKVNLLDETLTVRFRQGGEIFHPANRGHSQRLKKLFQEENIPPWERDLIPLIYLDDELIAVVGLWCSKKHLAEENEFSWNVIVSPK